MTTQKATDDANGIYWSVPDEHATCQQCGATPVFRGAGWPGMDADELDCPKCGFHWRDGGDE